MNSTPTLVVATGNAHKIQEIQSILRSRCRVWPMGRFENPPTLVEDADTFAGNAIRKATILARWLETQSVIVAGHAEGERWFVLADDSGLEVDALDGAPGVKSARFAALDSSPLGHGLSNAPDQANNEKLLRLLREVPVARRTARFRCILALAALHQPGESPRLFQGSCEGRIGLAPVGESGFGYDPLFYPDGLDRSFAQLGEEIKNTMSHRARALAALKEWLRAQAH